METLETRGGNTKTPRVVPSKYWCFTLNNYTEEEIGNLETTFSKFEILYGYGREVGEQGTPHLQGWIESKNKIRPLETFKGLKRIHWEKRKGTKEQNIKYCAKEGNYKTNVLDLARKRELLGIVTDDKLYEWQRQVLKKATIDKIDDREVVWVWSRKGCTGKTTLAKLLCLCHNAILLDGKKSDILYSAAEHVLAQSDSKDQDPESKQEKQKNGQSDHCTQTLSFYMRRIFILDLSRTMENFVSYDSIEKLKNGFWFSGKYESKMILIPPPIVIIFANFEPDVTKLSYDRWNIIKAEKDLENESIKEIETESITNV